MMLFLKVIIKLVVISFSKNLINDEIKLSRAKSKDDPGSDGGRKLGSTNKITLAKLSDKIDNLTDNLNKLAKIVTTKLGKHLRLNSKKIYISADW